MNARWRALLKPCLLRLTRARTCMLVLINAFVQLPGQLLRHQDGGA